jgi:glutamyl-Q tRNA(Asp) synthetase
LLRIEDIDRTRCRPEYETALIEDLAWLGLDWDGPIRRQSDHFSDYAAALNTLQKMGVLYPCFCTRKDIAGAISAPQDSEDARYPGTCRKLDYGQATMRQAGDMPFALRLDVAKAMTLTGRLMFEDETRGVINAEPDLVGDVVLARKDTPCSYHLCVTLDDAVQGVTLVTRGEDLLPATHIHRLLQALLHLPVPAYAHHTLLTDTLGARLAKRNGATSLKTMRESGYTPADIRAMIGLLH